MIHKILQFLDNKITIIFFFTLFLMFFSRIVIENVMISPKTQEKTLVPTHSEVIFSK